MLNLNLIDLYNGFVKNYDNLSLNKSSQYEEIISKESKFFSTLGKFLGYKIDYKGSNYGVKRIRINFKYDNEVTEDNKNINFIRESDIANDLEVIQDLALELKATNNTIINILETFSINRIEYLNNIILSSKETIKNDLLIVYVIRDILKGENYHYCYLFNNNGIYKNFIVKISANKDNVLTASYL